MGTQDSVFSAGSLSDSEGYLPGSGLRTDFEQTQLHVIRGRTVMPANVGSNSRSKAQKRLSIKEKIDKLNNIKIKNFFPSRDTIMKMKRQATDL